MLKKFADFITESLPSERSVQQLKKVAALCGKNEIGQRVKTSGGNLEKDGSSLQNVESYEDYMQHNKKFQTNWNNLGLKPFKNK